MIVLEKTGQIGGRNRPLQVGESQFDSGPTLLMMLDPFRRLFADVGERFDDHLSISLCEPSYRAFFADGTNLEATTDRVRMGAQIQDLAGPQDRAGYERLLDDLQALYCEAVPNFIERNYDRLTDFVNSSALKLVARHRLLANLSRRVRRYVSDERLRMLFSFQTMYLGLSPFEAPWVYAVLTWMEYGEGIWYPKGGLVEIASAIAKLAEQRGAEIRLNSPVARVESGRVMLQDGSAIHAKAVVVNADLPYAERELLAPSPQSKSANRSFATKVRRRRSSCSAFMMYLDYEGDIPELEHHNVFFGADFKGNLDDIFRRGLLPKDPAFYVCVSSKTDPERSAKGHSNIMVLVPCPNLDRPWSEADAEALRYAVFRRLCETTSFDPARIATMQTLGPPEWRDELNLDRGAAFGLSHHFLQSAYFRPSNRSKVRGVYFVGASTTPGNGLPMVLISAELVEQRLLQDRLVES